MEIHMSDREKNLFISYLQKKEGMYFEFGSGGSTVMAANVSTLKIISVENDEKWIQKVLEKVNNVKIIYINIGAVGNWGFPIDNSGISNYPKYSSAIDGYRPDIVLIDGRFRVACIAKAILNLNENGFIIVHDFWNRIYYHDVLEFLDVVDSADTLSIFKIKDNISFEKVEFLWEKYKTNKQ